MPTTNLAATPQAVEDGLPPRRRCRRWLSIAAAFSVLFALNVASRMLFIKLHIELWRLPDVGEFLLVLVAMAFFVLGILCAEKTR